MLDTPDAEQTHAPRRASAQVRTLVLHGVVAALAADCADSLDRPLQVLDLGGGTGGVAVPLAAEGHEVTVIDPSPDALASLARRASEHGLADKVRGLQGDGDSLSEVLGGATADLVCCHGTLEVVDDPEGTLRAIRSALGPDGRLSLAVAGRLAAVLARASAGDIVEAHHLLSDPDGRAGAGDPLKRRFDCGQLEDMLHEAGFDVIECRGFGILSSLVPASSLDSDAERRAVLDLDLAALDSDRWCTTLSELGSVLHIIASPR